jgi:hypothetical protein
MEAVSQRSAPALAQATIAGVHCCNGYRTHGKPPLPERSVVSAILLLKEGLGVQGRGLPGNAGQNRKDDQG